MHRHTKSETWNAYPWILFCLLSDSLAFRSDPFLSELIQAKEMQREILLWMPRTNPPSLALLIPNSFKQLRKTEEEEFSFIRRIRSQKQKERRALTVYWIRKNNIQKQHHKPYKEKYLRLALSWTPELIQFICLPSFKSTQAKDHCHFTLYIIIRSVGNTNTIAKDHCHFHFHSTVQSSHKQKCPNSRIYLTRIRLTPLMEILMESEEFIIL